MKFRYFKYFILTSLLPLTFSYAFNSQQASSINEAKIQANAPGLNPQALKYAVNGFRWALSHGDVKNTNVLTIVDFSHPSCDKRVWVINLNTSRVLLNTYTTQGKRSGVYYATQFSNQPGSDESSLGVYETLSPYGGKHGLSMRLRGLESGVNTNAYNRAIVVHPAWYATPNYVAQNHRTGRSWGCFGLDPSLTDKFIALTQNGSIIFAYASQEKYDPVVSRA